MWKICQCIEIDQLNSSLNISLLDQARISSRHPRVIESVAPFNGRPLGGIRCVSMIDAICWVEHSVVDLWCWSMIIIKSHHHRQTNLHGVRRRCKIGSIIYTNTLSYISWQGFVNPRKVKECAYSRYASARYKSCT